MCLPSSKNRVILINMFRLLKLLYFCNNRKIKVVYTRFQNSVTKNSIQLMHMLYIVIPNMFGVVTDLEV